MELVTPVAPWKAATEPKTVEELYATVNTLCTKLIEAAERRPTDVGDLQVSILTAATTALHKMTGCEGPQTDEDWADYDAV
jgi:hypothetical protein